MATEYPRFTLVPGLVGRLELSEGANNQTLMAVFDEKHGRVHELSREGELLAIDFEGAGQAIEDIRRKTRHYRVKPDLPDVDLRGLSNEGELTMLLNTHGIVPQVSEDLIPE